MIIKRILNNINILNIILVAALVAFASYSVYPTLAVKVKYALPAPKKSEPAEKEPGEPVIPSVMQYTAIVDENLFHPERRIPPVKVEAPPLPKPEFVLYGTMISDDLSLAYIEDLKAPRNTPGRGKRQVALRKGDSLSGFVLKDIETDKILMTRGEERLIVAMNDPHKAKAREEFAAATAPSAQQPQAAPAPATAQTRRESRRPAAVNSHAPDAAPPRIPSPSATQPQQTSTQTTADKPAPQGKTDSGRQKLFDFFKGVNR